MRQVFTTKEEIVDWFQKYPKVNYTIQEDLVVDIMGDIFMGSYTIPYFPFQFGIVSGDFDCEGCSLENLQGAPYEVKGSFYVNNNLLHSLEGCTPIVWQSFFCQHNQLTSLEGGPQEVYGDYLCAHNKLCSLKGAPNHITGDFVCSDNVELKDISEFKTKLSTDADFIVDKRFGGLLPFSHT